MIVREIFLLSKFFNEFLFFFNYLTFNCETKKEIGTFAYIFCYWLSENYLPYVTDVLQKNHQLLLNGYTLQVETRKTDDPIKYSMVHSK